MRATRPAAQCVVLARQVALHPHRQTLGDRTIHRHFLAPGPLRRPPSRPSSQLASSKGSSEPETVTERLAALASGPGGEPLLRVYLPIATVLGILMLLDAGYSGDWSRIGAITTDQEAALRGLVPIVVGGHGACAAAAAVVSARRGEAWPLRAAKTFASGFVGLVEVVLLPDEEHQRV